MSDCSGQRLTTDDAVGDVEAECPRGSTGVEHRCGYLRHYWIDGRLACVALEVQAELPPWATKTRAQTVLDIRRHLDSRGLG